MLFEFVNLALCTKKTILVSVFAYFKRKDEK